MQNLHSLKCEVWNYIESRNSHQELDDESLEFVENPNNNQAEKFDVIESYLMDSEDAFDNATNYDIGRVAGYRECLEKLQAHFGMKLVAHEAMGKSKKSCPKLSVLQLENIFTSLLKSHE